MKLMAWREQALLLEKLGRAGLGSRKEQCAERITGTGEDYRGCQTATRSGFPRSRTESGNRSGLTCQRWDANSPHDVGIYSPSQNPQADLVNNYCRNPGGARDTPLSRMAAEPVMLRIWCYTTDPNIAWEYCDPMPLWTGTAGSCQRNLTCIQSARAALMLGT